MDRPRLPKEGTASLVFRSRPAREVVATSVLVLVQALPPPWALTYTRSRGPCTLNPRGHAAAGPCTTLKEVHVYEVPGAFHWAVHPKPAGPRSCGAAHNPKINTFVRGPGGRRPAAGVEISPRPRRLRAAPPGPGVRGPAGRGRSRNFPASPAPAGLSPGPLRPRQARFAPGAEMDPPECRDEMDPPGARAAGPGPRARPGPRPRNVSPKPAVWLMFRLFPGYFGPKPTEWQVF